MALDRTSLSLWERADLLAAQLSAVGAALYSAITGAFRGKSGASSYMLHVGNAMIRSLVGRLSSRQLQYVYPSTKSAYESFMKSKGLEPENVTLNHGATGHWIGDKNAKNVVVYNHGGGFAIPASEGHFDFYTSIINHLNASNPSHGDIAIFFVAYTLTPHETYPTQLRQSISALQYILTETHRSPENIILGGDSAGGNLALAVLLHLVHPHPDIEPLGPLLDGHPPLAGVFAFAPWVSYNLDGATIKGNRKKDMIPAKVLVDWSRGYLASGSSTNGGTKEDEVREGDAWSEPNKAPVEWWRDAREKTDSVLFLAGRDEILFSGIEAFVEKVKSVIPDATYVVGHGETHVAPVYSGQFLSEEAQQGKALKSWLAARLW
ncbi:putative 6-hexanolactone hydrolase [Aspergillus affinis]|uniref:putative 6-hexanolactone hydrolase n=1 Tax=Aspergillus affinis TaxID=1070780 RepID=UPI0022FF04BF|nr:alpha/beta hydrolase fold protein [Aspergillus affinis]KAI9036344.1 alpha/beta hydrolase fold protein [Aspergillus affinis]